MLTQVSLLSSPYSGSYDLPRPDEPFCFLSILYLVLKGNTFKNHIF